MIGAAIRARLRHLLLEEKLLRIESVAAEVEQLTRERAEVDQKIPLWDRVLVFDDTPNEARAHAIDLALEPRTRVLAELREEADSALRVLGQEFPPFGLGVELERLFRRARGRLRTARARDWVSEREVLLSGLEGITSRIVSTWVPDFDPQTLFARLSDEASCRREAARPCEAGAEHPRLGVAPATQDELVPLVARRLLESDFFPAQAELAAKRAARDRLADSAPSSLLERLSRFRRSSGPQDALAGADEELRASFERTRGQLYAALVAYPPLAIHQRAAEALGVVSLLRVERVAALEADGRIRDREVIAPQALVFAALRRLLTSFGEAFPAVPLPLTVTADLSDPAIGRRQSPRELLERRFFTLLEEGFDADLRDQALDHAALSANLGRRSEAIRASMSIKDRILFWSNSLSGSGSQRRGRLETLVERREWHADMAAERWSELLAATRAISAELAPLAVRDLAIRAQEGLQALHTEGGEWKDARDCSVHGRETVAEQLAEIERVLRAHYGLSLERAALVQAVADQDPSTMEPLDEPFEPREEPELILRLATRLMGGPFGELVARVREQGGDFGLLEAVHLRAWSDAELERVAADQALAGVDQALLANLKRIDGLLERALDLYPPARLVLGITSVRARLDEVRAVCRPRTVDIAGSPETRFQCHLEGHQLALAALRRWCVTLRETYGDLPGAHELLCAWELRGIHDQGWLAEG